jgi:hypothetical protein
MVDELGGAAPVPASAPSTTMKSGSDPVSASPWQCRTTPTVADGQLETDRLAAGQFAQAGDELQQLDRRRERRGRDGETQSTPIGTPRVTEISAVTLAPAARRHGRAWRPATA